MNPSERILPSAVMNNEALSAALTTNWKEGAFDTESNSLAKQMVALITIVGQLYLGSGAINAGNGGLGASVMAYAVSNAVGYFNFG